MYECLSGWAEIDLRWIVGAHSVPADRLADSWRLIETETGARRIQKWRANRQRRQQYDSSQLGEKYETNITVENRNSWRGTYAVHLETDWKYTVRQ